jgi:glutaredoxin-like YruB-family protein
MQVRVYSTKTCPWCDKAKEYLKSLNVAFESIDVSEDREAAMELVKKTRQMGVPVIRVGERYIVGYQPDQIKAALLEAGLLS